MSGAIIAAPLTADAFAPFGDVIEATGAPDKVINQGFCGRYHDLAALDFGEDGRGGISIFDATPRALPYRLDMVERHPEGSQAFLPMTEHAFLVIVAPDENGTPGQPLAFVTRPGQGVNFHRGVWHGGADAAARAGPICGRRSNWRNAKSGRVLVSITICG